MNTMLRRTLQIVVPAAAVLLTACSGVTTIKSELVLDAFGRARIDLHQKTEAIELRNDGATTVRVQVLGKKDRVVSNLELRGHDQVRLDIETARAVRFENKGDEKAVVRWTLINHDAIEYTMAFTN